MAKSNAEEVEVSKFWFECVCELFYAIIGKGKLSSYNIFGTWNMVLQWRQNLQLVCRMCMCSLKNLMAKEKNTEEFFSQRWLILQIIESDEWTKKIIVQ